MGVNKWSCFACRATYSREHSKCPACGDELHVMGKYFKPPSRNKDREWRAARMLIEAGLRYEHGPYGKRPTTPAGVEEYLKSDNVQAWLRFYQERKTLNKPEDDGA